MAEIWEFEHSVTCQLRRDFAWQFWADFANWPAIDPSVEAVTLDGPFAAGTKGTTKTRDRGPIEWHLLEVSEGESATIEIPAPGAALRCFWKFEDLANGETRITQQVNLVGEKAGEYATTIGQQLEQSIPQAMRNLLEAMHKAAGEQT
jgi:hypothetical protein